MTGSDRENIHRAAARAALAVPGVVALQPVLADRLALAASRVYEAVAAGTIGRQEAAGVHGEITSAGAWHLEVRCILAGDHRVVDLARRVREDVRTAVAAYLDQHGRAAPVNVMVTVTRIV
ncbi:hypothetical protein [Streptomyces avidinii]|uniref:Ethanolamine transporter EutH n=1 Tax=Streptomyces avidinii TaxID=1895 RepID=A0ABS4KYW6_STRAV|nr:hypothetical protein [Streptomyces avidinii]MBP2034835.1 ethanolamine transporter EutH [Streptomyces avidinii]GGY89239.1 hypothetical protein GCM10010343_13070 [Streptomyces avidinii]